MTSIAKPSRESRSRAISRRWSLSWPVSRRPVSSWTALAIVTNGEFSFDALLGRPHPVETRIRLLSTETPAIFVLFDILLDASGKSLARRPLSERRDALDRFFASAKRQRALKLSPFTLKLAEARNGCIKVARRLTASWPSAVTAPTFPASGRCSRSSNAASPTAWWAASVSHWQPRGGLALARALRSDGMLDHVGFTSTIANKDRAELTARLEALICPPGFTGKAQGGQSRWSTEHSGG
jgi:ATP-dependent DNA ligase